MALRHQLMPDAIMQQAARAPWSEADHRALADVASAVASPAAAGLLLAHIQNYPEGRESVTRYLKQIVRYIPQEQLDSLAQFVQQKFGSYLDLQMALFKSLQHGRSQRALAL